MLISTISEFSVFPGQFWDFRKNHSQAFPHQIIPNFNSLYTLAISITSRIPSLHFTFFNPLRQEYTLSCTECKKYFHCITEYFQHTATSRQSLLIISLGISLITPDKNTSSALHFTFLNFFFQELFEQNPPHLLTLSSQIITNNPPNFTTTDAKTRRITGSIQKPSISELHYLYHVHFHELSVFPDPLPRQSQFSTHHSHAIFSNNLYSRSTSTAPISCVSTGTIFNPSADKLHYHHPCPLPEIQEYTLSCDERFKPLPYPKQYSQHTALSRKLILIIFTGMSIITPNKNASANPHFKPPITISHSRKRYTTVFQDIGVCSLAWSVMLRSRRSTMSAPHLLSLSPRRRSTQCKCLIYLWSDTVLNHVSIHKSVLNITLSLGFMSLVAVAITYFSHTQTNLYSAMFPDTPWRTMKCLRLMSSHPVYVILMLPLTTHTPESFLSLLYDVGQPISHWMVANNCTTSVSSMFFHGMVISLCLGLWTTASAVQLHRSALQTSLRVDPPLHPTWPALSWLIAEMDIQIQASQSLSAPLLQQALADKEIALHTALRYPESPPKRLRQRLR